MISKTHFWILTAGLALMFPFETWAGLGSELDKVNALVTGQVMKTGIIGGSVLGFVVAIMKGSMKMAFMVIGVGVAFAYFLGWIKDGSFAV